MPDPIEEFYRENDEKCDQSSSLKTIYRGDRSRDAVITLDKTTILSLPGYPPYLSLHLPSGKWWQEPQWTVGEPGCMVFTFYIKEQSKVELTSTWETQREA